MTKKNGRFDLDLSELVAPISIKIADYEATLTGDMALTSMAKMARAFGRISEVVEGDISLEDLGVSEDEMWELVGEVLGKANPPPLVPVRELLTTQAAIKLLTFLAARSTDAVTPEATSSTK